VIAMPIFPIESVDELEALPQITALHVSLLTRNLVEYIRKYEWEKERYKSELIRVYRRDSSHWTKVVDNGRFLIQLQNTVGKKRWVTLRECLLEIDKEHYSMITNINGRPDWNLKF
jgi:hypothetical protein